jgi:hypothetical protein
MSALDAYYAAWNISNSIGHFRIEGEPMPRVEFGKERNRMSLANCPDCNTDLGSLHLLGCTVEQCPLCDGSALGCGCQYEKRPKEMLKEALDLP